jgi:hypothetical protein
MSYLQDMTYPMQCMRCMEIHDGSTITEVGRYADCTTWRCPNCNSLIDDRPIGWGGSARRVDTSTAAGIARAIYAR